MLGQQGSVKPGKLQAPTQNETFQPAGLIPMPERGVYLQAEPTVYSDPSHYEVLDIT